MPRCCEFGMMSRRVRCWSARGLSGKERFHVAQPLVATKTRRDPGLAMRAPASVRGTAKQEPQRRCRKVMHAEHADWDCAAAPPVTQCRQRVPVDIECMIDGLGAARKHQRVLRASPYCICVGFFSVLRRHVRDAPLPGRLPKIRRTPQRFRRLAVQLAQHPRQRRAYLCQTVGRAVHHIDVPIEQTGNIVFQADVASRARSTHAPYRMRQPIERACARDNRPAVRYFY